MPRGRAAGAAALRDRARPGHAARRHEALDLPAARRSATPSSRRWALVRVGRDAAGPPVPASDAAAVQLGYLVGAAPKGAVAHAGHRARAAAAARAGDRGRRPAARIAAPPTSAASRRAQHRLSLRQLRSTETFRERNPEDRWASRKSSSCGAVRRTRRSRTSRSPGTPINIEVVRWLGRIKAAAARVNAELGKLDPERRRAHRRRRRPHRRRRASTTSSRSTSSRPARAPRRT